MRIRLAICVAFLGVCTSAFLGQTTQPNETTVKVKMTNGNIYVMKNAGQLRSSGSGLYSSTSLFPGVSLRVVNGETLWIEWSKLNKITIGEEKDKYSGTAVEVELTLVSGDTKTLKHVYGDSTRIQGETELGKVEVTLENAQEITVVRETQAASRPATKPTK